MAAAEEGRRRPIGLHELPVNWPRTILVNARQAAAPDRKVR